MSAVATIAGEALGVLGVVALDRDRDPLRQVPAPGQDAADQRVVDAELLAFLAQPLLGGARGGVEIGLVAGVQAWRSPGGRRRAAARRRRARRVRSSRRHGRSASAARWVARAWTRKRSGFSSQPPLDSKKSKLRRGAGDRQHAGGLEDFDRLGDAGRRRRAPGRCGWRSAVPTIARATSDSTASTSSPMRAVSAVAAASPARGTRSGRGSALRPRRRPRGDCRERACRELLARAACLTVDLAVALGGRGMRISH